jgi:hypothetical protein
LYFLLLPLSVKDQASIVRAQAEDAFEAAVKAPEIVSAHFPSPFLWIFLP